MSQFNHRGTALASAARTATNSSAGLTNPYSTGVLVFLDVSAASGTGGLVLRIQATDPVSGHTINLNAAPTAVTATGTTSYMLYPSASGGGATQVTSAALPLDWLVTVTHNDASSYTYSVGYSIID